MNKKLATRASTGHHEKKCGFTIKVKTKEVLGGDEVQPNKLLVCDLGSMLATKKPLAWPWRSII